MSKYKVGDKVFVDSKATELGEGSYVTRALLGTGNLGTITEIEIVGGRDQYTVTDDGRDYGGDFFREEDLRAPGEMKAENLKAGTVLVTKDDPSVDYKMVMGVFARSGETQVAVVDLYDGSLDRSYHSLDYVKDTYYIKGQAPEEETKEVTLQEVAEAMGIEVDKLRIKD